MHQLMPVHHTYSSHGTWCNIFHEEVDIHKRIFLKRLALLDVWNFKVGNKRMRKLSAGHCKCLTEENVRGNKGSTKARIHQGIVSVLAGQSGIGKPTVIELLRKFYNPNEVITSDGSDSV
ncbi:Uncharacterized protein Rs2_51407 [Raphanus sativus]|nr:Uncharacterized protein Rs2_51407 [Raphanus sativus]